MTDCEAPKPLTAGDYEDKIRDVTYHTWKRYSKHAEWDDIRQHLWVYVLENKTEIEKMEEVDLWRRLRGVADRYCRKEKAAKAGYETVDEYFYSISQLRRIVFDAFDPDAVPPAETFRTDELYSEWATSVADVRAGLMRVPLAAYKRLRALYEGGDTGEDTPQVREALWRLQKVLGGPRRA